MPRILLCLSVTKLLLGVGIEPRPSYLNISLPESVCSKTLFLDDLSSSNPCCLYQLYGKDYCLIILILKPVFSVDTLISPCFKGFFSFFFILSLGNFGLDHAPLYFLLPASILTKLQGCQLIQQCHVPLLVSHSLNL